MNDKSKKPNQRTGKPGVSSSSQDKHQARGDRSKTDRNVQRTGNTSKSAPATSAAASGQRDVKRTTTQASTSGSQRSTSSTQTRTTSSGNAGNTRNTTTHTVHEKKGGGGWLPPVALLFGLLGTLLSAYLWSKLNSLSEATTTALSNQQESTKTEVANVKTELTAALEENSAATDSKVAAIETSVQESTAELQTSMQGMGDEIRAETKSGNEEIATSTATAMQELTSNSESELNVISTSFNTGIRTLREDMDAKFAENETQVASMSESLATTHELASRGQKDWILAEVEYLLRTGHHRVKLAGDVKAGVLALESANDRLHALGDIDYFPVREQIKQEVTELRRLGPPDIEGLIFRLETAGKVADSLPMRESPKTESDSDASGEEAGGASKLGQSLMSKLNFSVAPSDPSKPKAKRRNKPTKVQLTASEALNTHLQAARLSALRADAERFQNHMDNALKYTDEMFDDSKDPVQTFKADLENIRETNIVPNIPILGSALSMFEKIDAKRGEK